MASRGNTNAESQSSNPHIATKEELVSEIERLRAQLREKDDQIAKQNAQNRAGEKGWMISTPVPDYDGRTCGILFEKGHAFIPARMPDAEHLVRVLTNDFGYSASEVEDGVEVIPAPEGKKKSISEKLMSPDLIN